MRVPVRELPTGRWDPASDLPASARAFGALILDGLILHELAVEDRSSLQLLGPGDLLAAGPHAGVPGLHGTWTCAAPTRIAVLDGHLLVALHRWPQIAEGIFGRGTEQLARLTRQLAIGQLPNVEQRLLAIFRLLAERWGRVIADGVVVPLALTHSLLGRLVGAQRPTVTLALTQLAKEERLTRRADRSWLLPGDSLAAIKPAAAARRTNGTAPARGATPTNGSLLLDPVTLRSLEPAAADAHAELLRTVSELRSSFAATREDLAASFVRYERTRDRSQAVREKVWEARRRQAGKRPDLKG